MQRKLEQVIDPETIADPLFGYRKVDRHEIDTITKGSLIRFRNGNDELKYGGFVVDVKNANTPVHATLCLVSQRYWELHFVACNAVYVKDKASKRAALKNAIGTEKMSSALERMRASPVINLLDFCM